MLLYSIVLLAAVFVVSVGATENLRSDKVTEQAYDRDFTIGGHTYASQEAFIRSGMRCGTKDPTEEEMYEVEQKLASMSEKKKRSYVAIDVYFHIITDTSGNGALTKKEVHAQMAVLNKYFKQAQTKFVLKDTTSTANNAWFVAGPDTTDEADMKGALRVGDASTLNIYSLANHDGILGWGYFPFWIEVYGLTGDGVVVDYRTLPGGSAAPYNLGQTLTHEVGHWMGLYHTFQGGCNKKGSKGDRVQDTPAVASPNFGCPPESTDSCPGEKGQLKGNDPIHNIMDYVNDRCMNKFSKGQKDRMRKMWKVYRK